MAYEALSHFEPKAKQFPDALCPLTIAISLEGRRGEWRRKAGGEERIA
jgi:hypothetical protein